MVSLVLPPLRERPEDIQDLVEYFINRFKQEISSPVNGISPKVLKLFKNFTWPGNVRELENVLKKAIILCKSAVLTQEDFPFLKELEKRPSDLKRFEDELSHLLEIPFQIKDQLKDGLYPIIIELVERHLIQKTLREVGNNQVKAAELLGINRITLRKRIKDFDLE